jgi:hypothetical protein
VEPEPRPTSGILFVAWDTLLRFADQLTELGAVSRAGTVGLGDRFAMVKIRMRRDGRLQAETAFTHQRVPLECS